MHHLFEYGWKSHFESHYQNFITKGYAAARIISIQGFDYHYISEKGKGIARLSGKLLHESEKEALPKVGDWVLLEEKEAAAVLSLLPRQNQLHRKLPGKTTERQVIATNIDWAFIVQALDDNFNPMRIERYLAQVEACGIPCTILLNKADLHPDPVLAKAEIQLAGRDNEVIVCSATGEIGLEELRNQLRISQTYVFIGSSGVGKSSLINALFGNEVQQTGTISDYQKGKHTTTRRDLLLLPNGSLLIDTPGMREFGVTEIKSESIEELAESCRFSNCSHEKEPGCAVKKALQEGTLDKTVYKSYLKLRKEEAFFESDEEERRRKDRQTGKLYKRIKNEHKKRKF